VPLPVYWVRKGLLLAGPYPGAPEPGEARARLRKLLSLGIREFVDLTEAGEPTVSTGGMPLRPYDRTLAEQAAALGIDARYRRFAIRDLDVPEPARMVEILDHLDAMIDAGHRPVYVHCLGGRGRTGTVVACHLIRHADTLLAAGEGDAADRAIEAIAMLRAEQGVPFPADSPQTSEQFRFVRAWARRPR
jgi:hypothetical protein